MKQSANTGPKTYVIGHPEQKPSELHLGNIELDSREKESFDLVKEKTRLKTIRVGRTAYEYDYSEGKLIRREIHGFKGICDTFGPFPLFIEKAEFEEIKQRDEDLTPSILFARIVERKMEEEALKEKNKGKGFVGIIRIVEDNDYYYVILPPADKSHPKLVKSLQFLAEMIVRNYGTAFEDSITLEPPPKTPIYSEEFFRLSPIEEKSFRQWIKETLKKDKHKYN